MITEVLEEHHRFSASRIEQSTKIYNIIIYLFIAIGLLPGGSGYFTCKQNMKLVTTKFKSGGLHEKHVVATWNLREPSQHLLIDTRKPRKTCVDVAGRRTFRVLTSTSSSASKVKKQQCTHNTTNTRKITTTIQKAN